MKKQIISVFLILGSTLNASPVARFAARALQASRLAGQRVATQANPYMQKVNQRVALNLNKAQQFVQPAYKAARLKLAQMPTLTSPQKVGLALGTGIPTIGLLRSQVATNPQISTTPPDEIATEANSLTNSVVTTVAEEVSVQPEITTEEVSATSEVSNEATEAQKLSRAQKAKAVFVATVSYMSAKFNKGKDAAKNFFFEHIFNWSKIKSNSLAVKDFASTKVAYGWNKTYNGAAWTMGKARDGVVYTAKGSYNSVRHPVETAKSVGSGISSGASKVKNGTKSAFSWLANKIKRTPKTA